MRYSYLHTNHLSLTLYLSVWISEGGTKIMLLSGKEQEIRKEKEPPDGEYYTAEEYAELYGVSVNLIRQWKKRGIIDAYNVNGKIYISVWSSPKLKNKKQKNV